MVKIKREKAAPSWSKKVRGNQTLEEVELIKPKLGTNGPLEKTRWN